MTVPLLLLIPVVASGMGLPIMDAPQQPDYAAAVLTSVNSGVVDIVRVACVTCLLVGVLLYFTYIGRRLGKDLMVGGVLLVAMGEYIIPAVTVFSR